MKARILPLNEWGRIKDTEIAALLPYVDSQNVAVVVVEDGERIVARWCVFQATHFEGLWIDPEYRGNAGVVRPLLRQAYALPQMRGERWAFSGAEDGPDEQIDRLLRKLGGKRVSIRFYAVPVNGTRKVTEEEVSCLQR